MASSSIYVLLSLVLLYMTRKYLQGNTSRPPLPPGPPRLPVLGNLFDFPNEYRWIHLAKHKDLYGPISSVTIFGQTIVLLNEREVATELLDGRSGNYSDRPRLVFASMCGMGETLPLLHYANPSFRAQRTLFQQSLGSKSVLSRLYHPIVEEETRRFVELVMNDPERLLEHVRTLTGAIIVKIAYGYSPSTSESASEPDPLIHLAEETVKLFVPAFQPASWIVDTIPALQYLPDWVPGTGFKRIAREWRRQVMQFVDVPFEFAKRQVVSGRAEQAPSFVSSYLTDADDQDQNTTDESTIKYAAATMYAAGIDTTVAIVKSFFLAMVLYPDVQKKAQAEMDAFLNSNAESGPSRLPNFSDRDKLPYVDALVKEVIRWHTVVPLGLPHVTMKDDVYRGFLIPKGSIVFANLWLYNHDPENYHDPFEFKPERFLSINGSMPEVDPSESTFGFGRRICAGKNLAESSIYIAVAMSLATLHVDKARDHDGREVLPVYETTDGMMSYPQPFKCGITARSIQARNLIIDSGVSQDDQRQDFSDAEVLQMILADHELHET